MPKRKKKAPRANYKELLQVSVRDFAAKVVTCRELEFQVERLQDECRRLRGQNVSLDAQLTSALQDAREKERQREARKREDRALLMRARDLLIHERVSAQFEGREVPSVPAREDARPYGWRVNGIGEPIDAIDQNSR